jgi:hypothetical protein
MPDTHRRSHPFRSLGFHHAAFAGLLPVLERVSGPEHPHTPTARANLARWIGRADGGPGTA